MSIVSYLAAVAVLVAAPLAQAENPCTGSVRVSATVMLRNVTRFVGVAPEPHLGPPEGIVTLRAVVDSEGKTSQVNLVKGHPILVPKAIDALRQWEFAPFHKHGSAMSVCFEIRLPVKNDYPATFGEVESANSVGKDQE